MEKSGPIAATSYLRIVCKVEIKLDSIKKYYQNSKTVPKISKFLAPEIRGRCHDRFDVGGYSLHKIHPIPSETLSRKPQQLTSDHLQALTAGSRT